MRPWSRRSVAVCAAVVASTWLTAAAAPQPAPRHFDFDDDQVQADVQRPDDPVVEARLRARFGSMIRTRANFLPELLRSAEDR